MQNVLPVNVAALAVALLLLVAANGGPVLARRFMGGCYAWPVDGGLALPNGRRLLGDSKTWRGLLASVCATLLVGLPVGLSPQVALKFAGLAMLGDLLASFSKRRLGKADSSRARGLDTVPESLLPLWLLREPLALAPTDVALGVGLFFLMEEFGSPLLYKWRIRRRPY